MKYSIQFKQSTVNRFHSSGISKVSFAKKYKIDRETLKSWINNFCQTEVDDKNLCLENKDQKDSISWTHDKKLWAVFNYESLKDIDRGSFLRKHGLYSHQVKRWKLEMTKGLAIGFKNLEDLKKLSQKIKEQEAIINLQKKTFQVLQAKVKS